MAQVKLSKRIREELRKQPATVLEVADELDSTYPKVLRAINGMPDVYVHSWVFIHKWTRVFAVAVVPPNAPKPERRN